MEFECNEQKFKNSEYGKIKIQAMQNVFAENNLNFHSWYLDYRFLQKFYMETLTGLVQPYIYNCYERLFDIFFDSRLSRLNDDLMTQTISRAYEKWLKEYNSGLGGLFANFGDLVKWIPPILLIGVSAYLINAIKK